MLKKQKTLIRFLSVLLILLVSLSLYTKKAIAQEVNLTEDSIPELRQIINSNSRSVLDKERDKYRHPLQTLQFFGINPKMTVVELWPGKGWYTKILAQYLAIKGQLIVTNFPEEQNGQAKQFEKIIRENPTNFAKAKIVEINLPNDIQLAKDSSADMVLTFRNIHNWIHDGYEQQIYEAVYKTLKPGGIFGVVEHRANPNASLQETGNKGYISEDHVITSIENAGFKLLEKSEINANPKDSKDYPNGVWSLPPVMSLGNNDRSKYLAIGESDRMTLKFVKPVI